MSKNRRIFIDFDGVITNYERGWEGYHTCGDTRNDEAYIWVMSLIKEFEFIVLSGRAATWSGRRCIRRWLRRNGYPRLKVTCKKVGDYIIYLDDRGWQYNKKATLLPSRNMLIDWQPWCKRKQQ